MAQPYLAVGFVVLLTQIMLSTCCGVVTVSTCWFHRFLAGFQSLCGWSEALSHMFGSTWQREQNIALSKLTVFDSLRFRDGDSGTLLRAAVTDAASQQRSPHGSHAAKGWPSVSPPPSPLPSPKLTLNCFFSF